MNERNSLNYVDFDSINDLEVKLTHLLQKIEMKIDINRNKNYNSSRFIDFIKSV